MTSSRRSRVWSSSVSAATTSSATSSCSGSWRPTISTPRTSRAACGLLDVPPSLLEVDVIGGALPKERVEEAVAYAAASAGFNDGHVAVSFVDPERIAELNLTWRGKVGPTDVLSFPIDEDDEDPFGER